MIHTAGASQFVTFTEADVLRHLKSHLQKAGFQVKEQVRVSNGVVDIVATRAGERWVIEAKGEDNGGFTSAELNFGFGVGQVVSRMNDATAKYALAFPVTADYLTVLRKYRESKGFNRLELHFFAVYSDGRVEEHDAAAFVAWIGQHSPA